MTLEQLFSLPARLRAAAFALAGGAFGIAGGGFGVLVKSAICTNKSNNGPALTTDEFNACQANGLWYGLAAGEAAFATTFLVSYGIVKYRNAKKNKISSSGETALTHLNAPGTNAEPATSGANAITPSAPKLSDVENQYTPPRPPSPA